LLHSPLHTPHRSRLDHNTGLGYQICDGFESFSGVGILEFASLSLDEPEMEAISFEEQVEDVNTEEEDGIAD